MTENVRKIFDMLGVEPNEEFKVDGYDYRYYIDSNLDMCAIVPSRDIMINLCGIFIQILKNPEQIIKLPKKKHVGDKKCNDMKEECLTCPLRAFDCPKIEMDMLDKDLCMARSTLYEIFEHIEYLKEDKEIYNLVKARLDKEVE